MSTGSAGDWLTSRADGVPPRLLARMHGALAQATPPAQAPISTQLGEAAVVCLRAALARSADRSGALDLLAADALLTSACEAAADEGPDALASLAVTYGGSRLATLLRAS